MKRAWRRRVAIVAVVAALALLGLCLFLRSGTAARLVASQLGDILNTTVTIDSLRAALTGDTSIRGLKLFNDGDDVPYLQVDQATVDVSMASAVAGKRLPDRLTFHGVRLRLRFDRTGKLLTKLPTLPQAGQLPTLQLRGLDVTLDQDGRPPLLLRRASISLSPGLEENLSGDIDDPDLGRFGLGGTFGKGTLTLRLTHPGLALTPARFRSLPFLPGALTRRLEAEGIVPLSLSLWLQPEKPRCRFRVAFGPALVRLFQIDRPPFAVSGVSGVVSGDDAGNADFYGDIRDPRWGDWTAAVKQSDQSLDLRLCTSGVAIDAERLAAMPFVPAVVWRHVQGTGRTAARVHVRLFEDNPDPLYRIEMTPRLESLRLAELDLNAADASGHVVVENDIVRLSGWSARLAGGAVELSGDLNFVSEPAQLRFGVDGVRLSLKQFPASWGLPAELDGRLSGAANLTLVLGKEGVTTRGQGAARLEELSIAGYQAPQPAHLTLRGQDLECNLSLPRVELNEVSRSVVGRVALMARATVPLDKIGDSTAWRGMARVVSGGIEAAGFAARDVAANAMLEGGRLRIDDARAVVAGGVVTSSLSVDLATLRAQGSLTARGLDFGRGPGVEGVTASVSIDRERFEVKDMTATTRAGVVTGWGHVVFSEGAARAEMHTTQLDLGKVAPSRVPVEGSVSGHVSGIYRPSEGVALQADLASARVAVRGVPATKLRGRLDLAAGRATYQLVGETLGGNVSVQGRYPSPRGEPGGVIKLERLRLARLWEALRLSGQLGELRGVVAVNLPFHHDGLNWLPVGRGRFEMRDLRWQDKELTDHFGGEFRVGPEGVSLRDAGGIVGGGSLRLSAGWRFADASRGWFDARLVGAELSKLPLEGDFKDLIYGPIDVGLRGGVGAEWRGSGAATLVRGKVCGVEVSDWRLPVEFTFAPSSGQAEVSIRESSAHVGNGRAQLRAGLRYAGGWRAEGQLVFFDAGMHSLAGLLGEVTSLARGRVTGRIDFAAAELRSLTDLTANVHAKLNDAQALQLPVLRLLVPHLLPSQGALEFKAGELRGTLSGGVFRIAEMTLDSSLLLLLIQGSLTLRGRLDLDVMAQTSSTGVDPLLLRSLLRRVPLIGPVPVALITRVTELLSDRVVHLRVSGSLRTPRVKVEPLRLLSDQAARFFLSRAVNAASP